ncbi:MAG: glutathione S-transferase family protein [Gammaproteobacteria bacterium]|nr:glutathione S-transferase family protein [Gammaproteobacteria bacterium]MDH5650639.1 glutathione S-transferase family protein [Gammaproteobacteria bacterium]
MTNLTLVSFNLCPYVQRSVIALKEKGMDYAVEYVDLYDKPDWFLQISPFGNVPVLKVGDQVLFESAVITEYLDEIAAPRLHPEDPLQKAIHRAWIEVISAGLVDAYKLMIANSEEEAIAAVHSVQEKFTRLEGRLADGEYFASEKFSLVDAAAAPMMQRLQWCEDIKPLGIFDNHSRVAQWRDALLARPSVIDSVLPDIVDIFVEYIKGNRSPVFKTDPTWLGTFA